MVDLMNLSDQVDKDFAITPASSAIEGSLLNPLGRSASF
jgi:hypothetical protein